MEPRLIDFPVHPDPTGNLAVADYNDLPFGVKRVFWMWDLVGQRGAHALKTCHQFLVVISGSMSVDTIIGIKKQANRTFRLTYPGIGLYLPPMCWRELVNFELGTTCFVLASHPFNDNDYIDTLHKFHEALMENEMEKGLKFADEETN